MDLFELEIIIRNIHKEASCKKVTRQLLAGKIKSRFRVLLWINFIIIFLAVVADIAMIILNYKGKGLIVVSTLFFCLLLFQIILLNNLEARNYKTLCPDYLFQKNIKSVSLEDQRYIRFKCRIDNKFDNNSEIKKLYKWLEIDSKKIDLSLLKIPIKIFSVLIIPTIILSITKVIEIEVQHLVTISIILGIISSLVVITYIMLNNTHFRNKTLMKDIVRYLHDT